MTAAEPTASDPAVEAFWRRASAKARLRNLPAYFGPGALESVTPPAWSFGADPAQADELAGLVLAGMKTATAGALWDYEAAGEELPRPLTLSIVLDGSGRPVALLRITTVETRPFDEVDDEHAWLEGEGDGSLEHWRVVHERFFTDIALHERGFEPTMPVVCERFEVLYSEP